MLQLIAHLKHLFTTNSYSRGKPSQKQDAVTMSVDFHQIHQQVKALGAQAGTTSCAT